ncbi:low-density lipoprotein receptor-related protein 2-like [Drosophila miranda]|uniref:low-density lipoprotein receptor-related protein 2-like n=1 Tax=Drosophila miranda TaxID=7229 RepID=UPI00143F335D|nr:low-density lipoprotein receptor-related protein 2-like [Drosophila miranda]
MLIIILTDRFIGIVQCIQGSLILAGPRLNGPVPLSGRWLGPAARADAEQCHQGTQCDPLERHAVAAAAAASLLGPYCNEGQFRCVPSLKCIPETWRCDGEYDCGEGDLTDEVNCTDAVALQCSAFEGECHNGECLELSPFCDGHWDCDSDELQCDKQDAACAAMNCSYNCKLTPRGPRCYCPGGQVPESLNSTRCVDHDECQEPGTCDQLCRNTPGSYECSCVSGYDKAKGGRCRAINAAAAAASLLGPYCNEGQFRCVPSLKCIPETWRCDGEYDCGEGDLTDEVNCTDAVALQCSAFEGECHNGECLELSPFCDGHWDCDSDELQCDKQDAACAAMNCSYNCKLTPRGPRCYCPGGQVPESLNSTRCVDHDECQEPGTCDQLCRNTPGSYECSCVSGYDKAKGGRCRAINVPSSEPATLTLFSNGSVLHISLQELQSNASAEKAAAGGLLSVLALPQAHAFEVNRTALVSTHIYHPNTVTLDLANEHVYWVDVYEDVIERVDYEGQRRWTLKKFPDSPVLLRSLQAIEVFENTIYLSPWTGNVIVALDRFTHKTHLLRRNVTRATNFRISHRQKQPEVAHPCRENNGDCNQICVPLWTRRFASARCLCTAGYKLHNQTTCLLAAQDKFLVYSDKRLSRIAGVPLGTEQVQQLEQLGELPDVMVPIYNASIGQTIDVNVRAKSVFYVVHDDLDLGVLEEPSFSIKCQSLNGSVSRPLAHGLERLHSMAYDWINDHLYWATNLKLHVAPLRNMSQVLTFATECDAMSIDLDPTTGLLYWTQWSIQTCLAGIYSAWMVGTHKELLAKGTTEMPMHWPRSLDVDRWAKRIYWCDSLCGSIERMRLDGTGREVLLKSDQFHPYSMVQHNAMIYWVGTKKSSIFHVHHGNQTSTVHLQSSGRSADLRIFDVATQPMPQTPSACSQSKCPGMYLNTPKGAICRSGACNGGRHGASQLLVDLPVPAIG